MLERTENLSDEEIDYRAYLDYKPAYSPPVESDEDSPMERRFIKDDADNVCFIVEDSPKATYMDQLNAQAAS